MKRVNISAKKMAEKNLSLIETTSVDRLIQQNVRDFARQTVKRKKKSTTIPTLQRRTVPLP
jgi:hypothetical protein